MKKTAVKYLLTLISILLLFPGFLPAQEKRDSVVVSLITCWPGEEVYELCGHEALRVRGVMNGLPVDSVWNYGVFDFNAPNFVYRFVKGETDYMLAGYPFAWFLPEYETTGRRVIEQDLNLTQDEAVRLVKMLQKEGRPENRIYRYNYVRDNCATRIVDRIDSVVGKDVIYPDKVNYGSFRREMKHYHKAYPWYQFGIDLALGSGLDIPVTGREEMFVPLEMAEKAEGARLADGRPLVRQTRVLNQGIVNASLPPTPWYLTPLTFGCVLFLLSVVAAIWMVKKRRILRGVYSVWFGITGLLGCLVTFLVFISEHEATSPNVLLLWLNPLQLLAAITVWSRRMRILSYIVCYYNVIVVSCLLIVWPFQRQCGNPAFFPLMGITLLLSAIFAGIAPKAYSANKSGEITFNKRDAAPAKSRQRKTASQTRRKTK